VAEEAGIEDVPRQTAATHRATQMATQMKYKTGIKIPESQPTRTLSSQSARSTFIQRSHRPSNPSMQRTTIPAPLSTLGNVLVAFTGKVSGMRPADRTMVKDEIGIQNLYVPGNETMEGQY
jgi:hypothetical protein